MSNQAKIKQLQAQVAELKERVRKLEEASYIPITKTKDYIGGLMYYTDNVYYTNNVYHLPLASAILHLAAAVKLRFDYKAGVPESVAVVQKEV